MPSLKRNSLKGYKGIYWIEGEAPTPGKKQRIYYVRYRKDGRAVDEKAGRQIEDAMTPARASIIRSERISGKRLTNEERRAEIETKAATLKAEKGKVVWTFSKLWEKYKETRTLKNEDTDQSRFVRHIEPDLGEKEPSDLVPLDIDRIRIRLQKTKKAATVRNTLELLRRIINFGISKRLAPGPGFKIEMPTVNNELTEKLDDEKMKALLKAIEESPHTQAGAIMKLALFTGMRRGEIFSLKWDDLDYKDGFILIRNPKGGHDQKIPLNDEARNIFSGIEKMESTYIFPGRSGERLVDLKKSFNAIKTAAGLPKNFRAMHGLRHAYASMLASSGKVDMYVLQKLMTHKSPMMTQRYAHLRDESLKKASALVGEIVAEATKEKTEKPANVVEMRK